MPSEQSTSSNASPTRTGSAGKGQQPPTTGGVRELLGLPMRESGVLPTAPLTAPSRGQRYEQPPSPASEENGESFREIAPDEELIEAEGSARADLQDNFPASLPRHGALSSGVVPEHPVDQRSAPPAMTLAHREHTSFDIPGVSTHRTEFTALSRTSDTTKITRPEESHKPSPDKTAPHASASLAHPNEKQMLDSEFLSRLEHFFGEGTHVRNDSEAKRASLMAPSPSLVAQLGAANGEQGDTDVVGRLAQLQRVVGELAATVSRNRDESQAQGSKPKTPPERMVVVQRVAASSTTPRAFWERSRLGRFYLRTGR